MPPLPTAQIDLSFAGLDTKTDQALVAPPALLKLQNGVFTKGGTIVKRNGYSPLSTSILGGGHVTTGAALATFDDELLQVTTTGEVYSYASSQSAWIDRGQVSPVVETESQIVRNTYTQSNPDMDSAFGVTVCAWEDTRGGIRASVFDESSGATIQGDVSISTTAATPQVIAIGSTICVFYADAGALKMCSLNTASPSSFAAAVTVDTTMPASGTRIRAATYDGLSAVVAWNNGGGSTRLAIVLPTGVESYSGYPAPATVNINCTGGVDVLWDAPNGVFWVAGTSSVGIYVATLTLAFVPVLAPTLLDANTGGGGITVAVSAQTLTAWYEVTAALSYNHLVTSNTITTTGTVGTAATLLRSVGLGSRVFNQGGTNYLLVNFSSPLQPTTFLVRADTGVILGKGQSGLSGGLFTSSLPRVIAPSSGNWSVPVPTRVQIVNTSTATNGTVTTYTSFFLVGIDRLNFSFGSVDSFRSVQIGENLHFAGGVVKIYDGQGVVEHGFHLYPESITVATSLSGGSLADGQYGVQVVWGWQDSHGQLHRSAPSPIVTFTITGGGGAGSATLTIPTLRLTDKAGLRTPPVAMVYRTPSNGTLYQRSGNGAADAVTAPVYSSTTADTVSFSLTQSDAQIAANEILYTTGGVLPNWATPPSALIAASKNRLILAGILAQPNQVWYSQPWIPGQPVSVSPYLTAQVDPHGGGLTAIAAIDTTVILFKESIIYYFSGEGPDSTGLNNQFTQPALVTSDVGCTNPESVAVVPDGLMFETSKGLYHLDRSLSASYIGAPVEAFNSLNTTSGVLIDGVNQVRFTASNGVGLVYDHHFRQWGTFTNFLAVDAANWTRTPGTVTTYVYLSTTGTVMLETPGVYLDNLTPIPLYMQTAWVKVGRLQGFFKIPWVTILGTFYSQHVLNVGLAFDYQGFVSELHQYPPGFATETYGTNTYGTETPYGGVSNTVYQFRFRPSTMKAEAVQFTFTEQSPTSGPGFSLSGLALTCALTQQPFKKLPASQTIGSS